MSVACCAIDGETANVAMAQAAANVSFLMVSTADTCQPFPVLRGSKFPGEFKPGAMALELRQIERDRIADLPPPDLRIPRRGHEHLPRELNIQRRTEHHSIAGESRQVCGIVMP